VVLEEFHEDVVAGVEALTGRRRDEGLETEPVADLVQHDRDEVELAAAGVAVETVVPRLRKRARRPDGAVEARIDVVVGRAEIDAGDLVGKRLWVVRVREGRVGEIEVRGPRAR
jgi:hypothetical protein